MIVLVRKNDQQPMSLADTPAQPQCHLLNLPAELRNQIYHYILVQSTSSRLILPAHLSPLADKAVRKRSRFCANILRTCKQIHTEGTPVLYGENIFSAHPNLLATLPSFLLLTRPDRVRLPPVVSPRVTKFIRRYYIYVRLDTDPRYTRGEVEESFNGVEELEVEVFQAMYGSCDFSVLKLFEGVRGVENVKISGSLGDGKYSRWLTDTIKLPLGTVVPPYFEQFVGGVPAWDAWSKGNR